MMKMIFKKFNFILIYYLILFCIIIISLYFELYQKMKKINLFLGKTIRRFLRVIFKA